MRIILIGNYPLDEQESMERFAVMLNTGFNNYEKTTAEIWRPVKVFGGLGKSKLYGLGKWTGYIDKWIIFPLIIKWRILTRGLNKQDTYFHVCDHSNSFYLNQLPEHRKAITCHDVIAIRAALGYADAHNPTSRLGIYLQKWILGNLGKADKLAAVSHLSLNQLSDLVPYETNDKHNWQVVHNAFNAHFYPMDKSKAWSLLTLAGLKDGGRFLLHVGSELPRKNRKLLVDMLKELDHNYNGYLVLAGTAIDAELSSYIRSVGLSHRIVSVEKPNHETLVALYSVCDTFVFPSLSEGFGWPVTEAQACGAVVIASSVAPMPEVSGNVAIYADPYQAKTFADAYLKLDADKRADLIAKGLKNADSFKLEGMIDKYLQLFTLKN